jgi:hypothetical protein
LRVFILLSEDSAEAYSGLTGFCTIPPHIYIIKGHISLRVGTDAEGALRGLKVKVKGVFRVV